MSIGRIVQIGGAVRHSPLSPLLNFTHNNDDDEEEEESPNITKDMHSLVIGGFIGEGYLAWRSVGATIEVFDAQTCIRQAAWTFGALLHYTSPVITCVCGIGIGSVTHIVIGVDLGVDHYPQGMVGILSLRRSRIIRAFRFQNKVTNVCMITGGEKVVDPSTLAIELRSCQGLLAVATEHASLFLVDLALDLGADEITSDEMSPASFVDMCIPDPQADLKRNKILSSHSHPVLCLSDNMNIGNLFRLLGPDDHILYETSSQYVNITSLMYIPQLASLVVGYSFGSFQLINLNVITIDCASPYEKDLPPVFSFAYQEPENDPKSFVYLWVCRSRGSQLGCEKAEVATERSTCSLYSMHYDKKEWIEGHGLWYQSLSSMSPRFSFKAIGGIGERVYRSSPSKLISAMSVSGTTPLSNLTMPLSGMADNALSMSNEEAEPVPELSLCLFCWEGSVLSQGKIVTQHYVAIFDINQWYQCQMPPNLRLEENQLCDYMSFHLLDKVPSSVDENLLGGTPLRGSWSRHSSRTPCEKMWYPSALSYEFNLLTSESLATYHCSSIQQSTISAVLQQGPGAVVHPSSAFKMCIFAGILSSIDSILNGSGSTTVSEREHILNTALEYHLLSLLTQCVVEFSEGRFSHLGCTSQLLLDWAWNKLKEIKNASDTICLPLLSSAVDGTTCLSAQNLINLHQNLTYLSHLSTIFAAIRDHAGEITTLSAGELEGKVQIANLLKLHLQVILWFYHCGLLPQFSLEDALEDSSVPFPANILSDLYEKRRKEIQACTGSEVLLIDSILDECGPLLAEVWDKERGEKCSLYPPTSLHAVLSMYLLPGIPPPTKHRIVQYLFLDLSSILSENYSNVLEELVKFPSSFSLSPSLIKLTQAFWLLDNKEFQAGLCLLLDPLVNQSDITQEQHRCIIKSFLHQGEEGHALTYTQIRKPPNFELEDIRTNLTILLANGRIRESFHYQRKHRVASNAKQLLNHMFQGCEQLGRLESVVHLPLSPEEEECFIAYLKSSKDHSAQDILLVYYLQKSRYSEISSLHESTHRNNMIEGGLKRQNARSAIVQGYMSHLPDVRTQLSVNQKIKPHRMVYSKPQPFSAHIRRSSTLKTPKSRATTLRSSYLQTSSSGASKGGFTPFRSKAQRRKAIQSWQEEMGLESATEPDITRLVFPSYSHDIGGHTSQLSSSQMEAHLWSKSTNNAKDVTLLQESITKLMEGVLRKSLSVHASALAVDNNTSLGNLSISQDVISLLKVTPVKHNRSLLNVSSNSLAETPQSILKVRKMLEQSHTVVENESPAPSFPRHRLSAKKNSLKKLDRTLESDATLTSSLTPKQLRFELPNRRTSVDYGIESNDDAEEDVFSLNEGEMVDSLQRKRKRGDSPPIEFSLAGVPSPRKPLPRYSTEKISPTGLCLIEVEDIEKNAKKSAHDIGEYSAQNSRSVAQVKSGMHDSLQSANIENVSEGEDAEELNNTMERDSNSSCESVQEESFHSVEEYEEESLLPPDKATEESDAVEGVVGSPKEGHEESLRNFVGSKSDIEEASHNSSRKGISVLEESETTIGQDGNHSTSEKLSQVVRTSSISVSEIRTVRETLLFSESEDSNLSFSSKSCKNVSESGLPDFSCSNTINAFGVLNEIGRSSITANEEEDIPSPLLININCIYEKESMTMRERESKELEKNREILENTKEPMLMSESEKRSKNFVHNPISTSEEEIQERNNNNNNNNKSDNYALQFSDSEGEEIQSVKTEFSCLKDEPEFGMPLTPNKHDSILVDSTKSLSQADTIVLESSSKSISLCDISDTGNEVSIKQGQEWSPSLNANLTPFDCKNKEDSYELRLSDSNEEEVENSKDESSLVKDNNLGIDVSNSFKSDTVSVESATALSQADTVILNISSKSFSTSDASSKVSEMLGKEWDQLLNAQTLPSDLESAKPLQLTTQERELVDEMIIKDPSLSFNHFSVAFEKEKNTPLNKSVIPVLQFSNDEIEVETGTCVVNGVSPDAGGYASDDSEKTVEFDLSEFSPPVEKITYIPATATNYSQLPIVDDQETKLEEKNETSMKINSLKTPLVLDESKPNMHIIEDEEVGMDDVHSPLEEKVSETSPLICLEMNPDDNNIQKRSIALTPCKEECAEHSTPSRRRRHFSGLSSDVVGSTPLRRSTRLSLSTPSKIETTPLRRRRRTSGTSDISEDVSNVDITIKHNVATTPDRLHPVIDPLATENNHKSTKGDQDMKILGTPSRRRRRVSSSSDVEDGTPKILATPSRRRRRASGASDTSEVSSVIEEESRQKGVSALEERLGLYPIEDNRISIKENVSPGGKTPKEVKTSNKHQDTPRRRSARISGVKENLGTIMEDLTESIEDTSVKVTPLKMTPKRSRRKASIQNMSVIEPILETIKEDSELIAADSSILRISSLPNSHQEIASLLPKTPSTATSLRRAQRKYILEADQEGRTSTPEPPRVPQLPLSEETTTTTTTVAATPVTATSMQRTQSNTELESSEISHQTHASELPNSSEEEALSVSLSDTAVPNRRSRRAWSETPTSTYTSTALKDNDTPSICLNINSTHETNIASTRRRKGRSQSESLAEMCVTLNSTENCEVSDEVQGNAPAAEAGKQNYTLISPEEATVMSVTARMMRRYSEKRVNSVLSNSQHSTALSRRQSLRKLSIPAGFEFPNIQTCGRELNHRSGTISELEAYANMEVGVGEDDVFEEEAPNVDGVTITDIGAQEVKPSPVPYKLLEVGENVVPFLPRRVSKAKSRSCYRRSIASLKTLNSRKKATIDGDDDDSERPLKKVKNGLAPSQDDHDFVYKDMKEDVKMDAAHVKGFLFQNPEVISAADAVSEVFSELTKEHERIVSDAFVFSPPFSLNENRRKKIRDSSRNSRK